jgi:hypothetical protein
MKDLIKTVLLREAVHFEQTENIPVHSILMLIDLHICKERPEYSVEEYCNSLSDLNHLLGYWLPDQPVFKDSGIDYLRNEPSKLHACLDKRMELYKKHLSHIVELYGTLINEKAQGDS